MRPAGGLVRALVLVNKFLQIIGEFSNSLAGSNGLSFYLRLRDGITAKDLTQIFLLSRLRAGHSFADPVMLGLV
jgi:hypothetical protein